MRRLLLSASVGLALMAGVSLASPVSAQEWGTVYPRYETVTARGQQAQVTVVRATLFELYGYWPEGFEPRTSRTGLVQGTQLDITNPGGFVRKALLYWKFNDGFYEPKVSLTMFAYATPEYLTDPATNPNGTLPVGLTDPDGNPFINPVTNQPTGEASPNTGTLGS